MSVSCEIPSLPSSPQNFCLRPTRYNYASKVPRPSAYSAESTLHHDKPDILIGPERLISHDRWVTSNGSVYDRKFYRDERDFQPKYPLAPSLTKIHYVVPDYHRKIQGVASKNMKAYNPFPNRLSESKANFTPHYPEAPMFGQAGVFITDHFVHLPENRVNVKPSFCYDDMFSVLRKSHPYMTTYRINHKNFEDELPRHKFLDSLYNLKIGPSKGLYQEANDVAIKLRVRPMLDPFEQNLVKAGSLPSLDEKRSNPGDVRNNAHIKQFFRRPPYNGCPPRVHQPVPHCGMNSTYKDSYHRPLHPNMALNHCSDAKFAFVQPKLSLHGLMRTPAMYESENNIYGSGKSVVSFICNDTRNGLELLRDKRDKGAMNLQITEGQKSCRGK